MHLSPLPNRPSMCARSRNALLPVLVAVLLTACAPVGPDFVRPEVPVNPGWLDAELDAFETNAAQLAEWWRVLEDPVLDELIATARRENNTLEIAGLRVLESQARLNIAVGSKYPQQQVLAGNTAAIGVSETTRHDRHQLHGVQPGRQCGLGNRLLGPLPARHRGGGRRPACIDCGL